MANLQTISAGILEEHCIVPRSFIVTGAFHLPRSRPPGRLGQPVHLRSVLCPKRYPASVGLMQGRFGDPEKFRDTIRPIRFERQPAVNLDAAGKAQRRQEDLVEAPGDLRLTGVNAAVVDAALELGAA